MYRGGYTGKVLRVDLTAGTSREEALPEDVACDFIGGVGVAAKYLYDEVPADCDPLGPENKLVYACGPFTGTTIPCSSRMAVNAKSPLTSVMGAATTGGHFPIELKAAGYDAIIVQGRAERPTYIWIRDGQVALRSADELWGLFTSDCQQAIKDKHHDQNIRVSCIGPAGEKLSRLACIVNERRVAGRKGLGAVMGSKNLKAIAVRGSSKPAIADQGTYTEARRRMLKAMKDSSSLYPHFAHHGTSGNMDNCSALGIFPVKNWTANGEQGWAELIGMDPLRARGRGKTACGQCPVGCSQLRVAGDGPYEGIFAEGPEYETIYSFGGTTGVTNPDAIIACDRLSDEYGLDTVSAGVAIGFAMELFERGILTLKDTGGMPLRFGDHGAMVRLLRMMGVREGLGDLLTDGVKRAAAVIGQGADRCAIHIKGMELPAYDPRGAKAMAMSYITAFCGPDHNKGYANQEIFGLPIPYPVDRFDPAGKGELAKWNQDAGAATCDSPTMCAFILGNATAPIAYENTADLMRGATGLDFTPADVERAGERINNLGRVFSVKAGLARADDDLPERLKTEPIPFGPAAGHTLDQAELDGMLDDYYRARGWSLDGIPRRAKLEELGLGYAADEIGLAREDRTTEGSG
jgi:aldehyde:ferredoxin oxidoreductase